MEQLYKMRAFPKNKQGGNKAGVYVFSDNLTDNEMQSVAYDLGYSETAFVSKSNKADYQVRFFTPKSEVDLCGHATIATFNLLRDIDIIKKGLYSQETKAGILKINVLEDMVYMQQNKPFYGKYIDRKDLDACFKHLNHHETLKPQIISTGLREIFLPVKDKASLEKIIPNEQAIINLSKIHGTIGIHVFCLDEKLDAYGRNFAPILGILEESATGTSNGALACYLYQHHHKKTKYTLRQGYTMNQPSEILVRLDINQDKIISVWVGGKAFLIKEKTV